ncbi:hypothetical protein RIF29_42160 [Crotalaria pallida]|uniref:Glycosyltransferase n=1 Tax=Crotalaria pallida TaxID=3830 RepID=A0AAN9E6E6_CROPI
MEEIKGRVGSESKHVLMVPYQSQGHINPLLNFSKRLSSKGVRVTIVISIFISKSMHRLTSTTLPDSIQFETISDGYDQGGFAKVDSIATSLSRFEAIGTKNLRELIQKYDSSDHPINCIVYDPVLPWALDAAKEFGLLGAAFFTQMCGVNYIYYNVYHGLLKLPISSTTPLSFPGFPLLELKDMPSFVNDPSSYPAYLELIMNQYINIHKADFMLVNSFYKLEDQVVDTMSELLTIGPTVPSFHLDKRVPNDTGNDLNVHQLDSSAIGWLKTKPPGSVVYVSFGSMVSMNPEQMEQIALGLKGSGFNFLWVITGLEKKKLSPELFDEMCEGGKGLVVNWIHQLEVLSNQAIGCFITHCGWNSTIEAMSLGVPLVAMPQWTDQPTVAKFIEDVWKVGLRVKANENGIMKREEIEFCLRQVMEKDIGKELRINAKNWREMAIEAVSEGGTSDNNINEFVKNIAIGLNS